MTEQESTENVSQAVAKSGQQYPNWCFTYAYGGVGQYTKEEALQFWDEGIIPKAHYAIAGWETAPSTGQAHLQGYVQFESKQRLTALKKLVCGNTVHWEPARGDEESNIAYCSKEGNIICHGEPRVINGGVREKKRWQQALDAIKANQVDSIDAQIQICHAKNVDYLINKFRKRPADLPHTSRHLWIYGPSGSGKSRQAREMMEGHTWYDKLQSKWWDYYDGEEYALIDDLEKENARCLIAHLKRWLDIYPFVAEFKGGMAKYIRPRRLIITSNFHPHEIFGDVASHWEPIERRIEIGYLGPPEKKYVMPTAGNTSAFTPPLPRSDTPVPIGRLTRSVSIRPDEPSPFVIDITDSDEEEEVVYQGTTSRDDCKCV